MVFLMYPCKKKAEVKPSLLHCNFYDRSVQCCGVSFTPRINTRQNLSRLQTALVLMSRTSAVCQALAIKIQAVDFALPAFA